MSTVRVRFAPSPTGAPHIGSLRTALFVWLWARHSGGKFILRVEDTDQKREVDNGLDLIMDSLRFLGLDWDEGPDVGGAFGPYVQSQRLAIYQEHIQRLVQSGHAYRCYCTPERLEQMRKDQQARGEATRYDRKCRNLSAAERSANEREGAPYVVRLAVPLEGNTTLHDFIHGDLTIANRDVDDQVLIKSDGFPTYHFAVVVDDHLMQISHVMRADEWISSFPKHVLLYQAFGWEIPLHGHVPDVLGPDKKKLSKRHGSTSVLQFRDDGYLPEAVINFLARLGWALDDKSELFTREDLIRLFTLDRIEHAPAVFDREKLDWMNGHYIRELSDGELAARLLPFLERAGFHADPIQVNGLVPLVRVRLKKLSDVIALSDFIFLDRLDYDARLLIGKRDPTSAQAALAAARAILERHTSYEDEAAVEGELRGAADQLGQSNSQFFGTIRVAISGRTVSLPLMGSIRLLGQSKTLDRIDRAIQALDRPT